MKLQLLTCGLVFGQKDPKPTFDPVQSLKRYKSISNQYQGLFSTTFRFVHSIDLTTAFDHSSQLIVIRVRLP